MTTPGSKVLPAALTFFGTEILRVGDLLQPNHDLAIQFFLNRDMAYGGRPCGAMPVALAGWDPYDIAGPDFLDRAAIMLNPTHAGSNHQCLAQRVRMPCGPGAGFERHQPAGHAIRVRPEKRVDTDRSDSVFPSRINHPTMSARANMLDL
jgi:hypothetical protein